METVLEREALRDRVELSLALAFEVFRPLAHEELGDEDVARQAADAVRKLPHGRRV